MIDEFDIFIESDDEENVRNINTYIPGRSPKKFKK